MASGVEDAPGIKCLGFIQNFQAEFLFFDLKQGSFWLQICGKTLLRNVLRNIVHGFCSDPSP